MEPPMNCPFCSPPADVIVAKNRFCYARWDRYPVSKGHMLVIPFRHVQDFFDLAGEEKCAITELVGDGKGMIEKAEKPAGYTAFERYHGSLFDIDCCLFHYFLIILNRLFCIILQ